MYYAPVDVQGPPPTVIGCREATTSASEASRRNIARLEPDWSDDLDACLLRAINAPLQPDHAIEKVLHQSHSSGRR